MVLNEKLKLCRSVIESKTRDLLVADRDLHLANREVEDMRKKMNDKLFMGQSFAIYAPFLLFAINLKSFMTLLYFSPHVIHLHFTSFLPSCWSTERSLQGIVLLTGGICRAFIYVGCTYALLADDR